MTLSIARMWQPSPKEWDDAWLNCPYSTYFHSREWAETWASYSRSKVTPDPLGLVLSDGTEVILPFSREKIFKGLAERHVSSPAGTYGGWLANVSLDKPQQTLLMQVISERYPNLTWRLNPYERVLDCSKLGCLSEDETYTLDMSVGFDEIFRRWTKGHASAARKARKAGVAISVAETPDDWKVYFRAYEDSIDRWGKGTTTAYYWPLFETILNRASPNTKLWVARHEGKLIAGALCFYSPTHVVYWHGAALSDYFGLRPVNLLIYEAIHDAAERGFRWFDFNPSGNLEGVKAFKRSFGAMPIRSDVVERHSKLQKLIMATKVAGMGRHH